MAVLLKGTDVVNSMMNNLGSKVVSLKHNGINPHLAIIRVGESPDDLSYEKNVTKKCEKLGILCKIYSFNQTISHNDFFNELVKVDANKAVHGILIFRPLPKHIDENKLRKFLNPLKDIDCLTPVNTAKVFEGDDSGYFPCTAEAVMELLDFYNLDPAGKNVVIIGRSMVVGKPLAMMMLRRNATVTICHSKTDNLHEICKNADILVAALGRARFITEKYISPGTVVIDVGINVDDDGNLCGDVDFESVEKTASHISPVPGGVGAVTSSILLKNTIKAAARLHSV